MPGGLTILAPVGLAALIAAAAIVIIHMRQRTPPAMTLPSLRFWEPVEAQRADRRRLQPPPITLPLVLQLLAAVAIALALARPVANALPGLASQRTDPTQTIVILDGSTSMLALAIEGDSRTRWDVARNRTTDVLADWQAGDVVTILVTGNQVESWSASTRLQADRLSSDLRDMRAPGGVADIDAALGLASRLVVSGRDSRVLLITDGAVAVDLATSSQVSAPISLQIVGQYDASLPNVAVTSIGARSVVGRDNVFRLSFAISSFAETPVRLPYRVLADGVEIVASDLDLAAGETRPVEVTLPEGSTASEVVVDVRDLFMADNRAQLLMNQAGNTGLDILLLSDDPTTLERALGALPEATVDTFSTSTPGIRSLANAYDLVVFHGVSPEDGDIPNTPMLFVRPAPLGDRFSTSGVLGSPAIDQFEAASSVLDGVDLAGVTFGNTPLYTLASDETALVTGSDSRLSGPLIWMGLIDDNPYVTLGFDLATSNITQRVAFPILIARTVEAVTAPPLPGVIGLGDPIRYTPGPAASEVAITDPEGEILSEPVLDEPYVVFTGANRPGIYSIAEYNGTEQPVATTLVVVNAGSLAESDLRPNDGLLSSLRSGSSVTTDGSDTRTLADLWPVLVTLAFLVILIEWLVCQSALANLAQVRHLRSMMGKGGQV